MSIVVSVFSMLKLNCLGQTFGGLVSAPHVLISADQQEDFSDQWIRIIIPPSPAFLAGKQLSNGPTQHYSALISAES